MDFGQVRDMMEAFMTVYRAMNKLGSGSVYNSEKENMIRDELEAMWKERLTGLAESHERKEVDRAASELGEYASKAFLENSEFGKNGFMTALVETQIRSAVFEKLSFDSMAGEGDVIGRSHDRLVNDLSGGDASREGVTKSIREIYTPEEYRKASMADREPELEMKKALGYLGGSAGAMLEIVDELMSKTEDYWDKVRKLHELSVEQEIREIYGCR